jgi:hypothetical protein
MRLLLCLPSPAPFSTVIDYLNQQGSTMLPKKTEDVQYLYSTRFLQHDVDVAFIGESLFEVNYKVTKAIQQKYHLALKVGFCDSLKADLAVGTVVNVIKEKPLLMNVEGKDVYESGMLNANDYPHFKGAFVNMNNSYMNVFLDLKKVVSGTLTSIPSSDLQAKYALDTITSNGVGFAYPCMFERQPFYQVNVVKRNLASGEADEELAQKVINEVLIDILQKI